MIDLIFEAGNRSQVSCPLKLQESDGALLEKRTMAFALQGRRKVMLKRMNMMAFKKNGLDSLLDLCWPCQVRIWHNISSVVCNLSEL